jgi:hypothetical protein
MNRRDTTNDIIERWFADLPAHAPDRVLDAVLAELPALSQQGRLRARLRRILMPASVPFKLVGAAVIALAIAVVGLNALPRTPGVGSVFPSPVPSAVPTMSPSTSPSPSPSPARFREGPLEAGTYTTQPFAGRRGLCIGQAGCIEAGPEDDSIRVTLTVPDGWAGLEGGALAPSVESYLPPDGAALIFMRGGWLHSELCAGPGPDIPTGTTVDEFVTALVDHPDLDVTSPVDVTLAGHSGKYLELRAPANTTTDELGPDPGGCNYYFVWEPGIYAQGPNALWRIWVLDVDGIRMVVRSDSFPATTAQVQAELAAIVDSIQIEP